MKPPKLSALSRLVLLGVIAVLILSCRQSGSSEPQALPQPSPGPDVKVTFLSVGDIMLSRGVERAMAKAGDPLAPFKPLADLLQSTDFNFGNLESPISGNDNIPGKGLVFNAHTRDIVGLSKYNFKVLNLANNHAMDQRLQGLLSTGKYLDEQGIIHMGTGRNLAEAWEPKFITVRGVKIGFVGVSYSSVNDGGVAHNDYVARIEDRDRLKSAIEQLKPQVDFIIVTMHAGVEYTRRPNQAQVDFAHAAIDYGADLVIGAHPHWVQVTEQYKGKYIFYSLGNFIFDQEWSQDTKEGLAIKTTLVNKDAAPLRSSPSDPHKAARTTQVEQIELIPVIIERYSTPRAANEEEARRILSKIGLTDKIMKP
ncbi:MAG TPA: CapA family protein [Pyrinomonadaceae bacterium]|nr:CapA family protein [Pyrinomonadaceae bacterium]